MSWIRRYRTRSFLRNSLWFPPLLGMVGALVLFRMVRWADMSLGWEVSMGVEGARALLSTLASAMFTFIVFVFSILLLSVQLASAQLTPRIIAFFYRNPVLKFSLSVFVFTFTFSLAVIFRTENSVLPIAFWLAVWNSLACIGIFLYMIDHVGKSLRPISLLNQIGNAGREVILDIYPQPLTETDDHDFEIMGGKGYGSSSIIEARHTGVVLAFDVIGLTELARSTNSLIELIPQVGNFIASGDPLFRVYQPGEVIPEKQFYQAVAIGNERTMEQDPGFAFRIIVDIASKALSPAINDPTTAVIALDQIHRLLRVVARQKLDTGRVYDNEGKLRLIFRTPNWDDFINLAITEIRHYGKNSLQVVRRLKALLENLIDVVPPNRAVSLKEELEILKHTVEREFPDTKDQKLAISADSLGMG